MKTKVPALAVTTFMLLTSPLAHAEDPVKSTSADLNGDGKPEAISVDWKVDDSEVRGITVVDLDSGDKFKEVAVHMGLTDSDASVTVYGFDGKALKELGNVHALTEARGNGIILSDTWVGFWNLRQKYTLD